MREGNDIPRSSHDIEILPAPPASVEIQERFDGVFFPMLVVGHFEGLTVHRASDRPCLRHRRSEASNAIDATVRTATADASDGSLVLGERFDLRTVIGTIARDSVILPARLLILVKSHENPDRMNAFSNRVPDKT